MLLENKQPDLEGLKLCPVHAQKVSKHEMIFEAWSIEALQKMRMSSAKKRCVIDEASLATLMP